MSTEVENAEKTSAWVEVQKLLNTMNHVLIALVAVYMTSLAQSHSFKGTALHAFLTTVGFHVLMAEALMCHYPLNPWTKNFTHRNKSKIHGVLQLVGGSMGLLGVLLKIISTEVHFTTLHGKFGLGAALMCLASVLGGLVNYYQPKFAHKLYTPSQIKFRHNFFGMITFSLAMTTMYLGYRTKFFEKYVDAELVPALSFATISVYFLTLFAPLKSLFEKLKHKTKRT